jgi:hypothetical protein
MDIENRIDGYLNKNEEDDSTVDNLLQSFESLDESRKSQFVAKLIGLGVLVKDKNGKLKQGKVKASKEEVIKKLKKKK